MKRSITIALAAGGLLCGAAGIAAARGLGVEVWTDRGNDAVYQPGDGMTVKARTSDDAWLLVYEIDTEGYVRVLHPHRGHGETVRGGQTLLVPDPRSDIELVVQQAVGQSYIVAIASREPFAPLPAYLRPYSAQEEALGYFGGPDDEEGVTSEGRIVGDPFVAMERIRRRVLENPDDDESFATSYTTYYVHTEVRYPRYVCYDCHRPNRWAWWDGFDPYYTDCSVFTFRVNWSWYWGPSYWFGHVPYYVYVYRPDCPPRYRRHFDSGVWYSAWDGWNRWCDMWGNGGLRRYKTRPPADYVPPARWKEVAMRLPAEERQTPPGFLGRDTGRSRDGVNGRLPNGRVRQSGEAPGGRGDAPGGRTRWTEPPGVRGGDRQPRPDDRGGDPGRAQRPERDRGAREATPVYRPREEARPQPRPEVRPEPRRESRPESRPEVRPEPRRESRPEPPRESRPAQPPRVEEPKQKPPPSDRGGSKPDFPSGKGKR